MGVAEMLARSLQLHRLAGSQRREGKRDAARATLIESAMLRIAAIKVDPQMEDEAWQGEIKGKVGSKTHAQIHNDMVAEYHDRSVWVPAYRAWENMKRG